MACRLLMGETLLEFNKKAEELKVKATEAAEEGVAITNSMIKTIENLDSKYYSTSQHHTL